MAPTSRLRTGLGWPWLGAVALAAVVIVVAWLLRPVGEPEQAHLAAPPAEPEQVPVGERRGALVDEVVFSREGDRGQITELIEGGSHQIFAEGLTNATIYRRIRDSQRIAYDISYGTSGELALNTAGPRFEDGRINPLHDRTIREALNWLVDRRHIAEEIYGGLAVPRYLPINTAFPDSARLAEVVRQLELRYWHDPERAHRVIGEAMRELGAERNGGQWMYNGSAVDIRVLIRTEDERHRVGDYVADRFEELGFRVERLYRAADEASRIWLSGDPNAGRWHVYTGGWISTLIQRDLAANLNDYYTPRGRPDPLWQTYDPDPELDAIAERLARRDYTRWEERQAMMARGLELAMQDSARIWLVDQINVWPRSRDVSVSVDLAGGISGSALWPYTLRYRDRIGGRMLIGLPNLLTEPWNPVAGSNWIFDQMIMRGLSDLPLLPDPFTGLFWPQRIASAEVTVQEDVPVIQTHDWLSVETAAEIEVPEDAWIDWDVEEGRWITAGEKHPQGVTARTRVRVQYEPGYLEQRWHDGTRISLADMVLPWILSFERADEASRLFDLAHRPVFEVFRRHFRGRRIVSQDPLVVEIYSDQIYPDAEQIVAARTPGVMPWHKLAVAMQADAQGELAFSSMKADRNRVEWINLVDGPSLPILERQLNRAREQGYVPFAGVLEGLLRDGEAEARYHALSQWYEEQGHFWVDNGPFYLHSVHALAGSVVLRRFEDFPDRGDKWLRFTEPRIPALDLLGPMVVPAGEAADFELEISFDGEAYPREDIERVRYLLFDSDGELVVEGDAEPDGDGRWRMSVAAAQMQALGIGANSLEVAVTSRHVALPAFASHAFATVPGGSAMAPRGSGGG